MARARPGLEKAVNDILQRHGGEGKRLSFRQAERLTGLSPATIGELAKGNARTPETIRRFAQGMNEDVNRLLLLAGFVPEDDEEIESLASNAELSHAYVSRYQGKADATTGTQPAPIALSSEERSLLERFEQAMGRLPLGRDRELWCEKLRSDTDLLERFVARLVADRSSGLAKAEASHR